MKEKKRKWEELYDQGWEVWPDEKQPDPEAEVIFDTGLWASDEWYGYQDGLLIKTSSHDEAANQYVKVKYETGDIQTTEWTEVATWEAGTAENGSRVHSLQTWTRVSIEPTPPRCIDHDAHDWKAPRQLVGGVLENPGVVGHSGGVISITVCAHCGVYREVDTWAKDHFSRVEGLTSTTYLEADEESLEWARLQRKEKGIKEKDSPWKKRKRKGSGKICLTKAGMLFGPAKIYHTQKTKLF